MLDLDGRIVRFNRYLEDITGYSLAEVRGADWFASIGPEKSSGTKIFCVSGKVERPGNYEAPMGTPARVVIDEKGKGLGQAFLDGEVVEIDRQLRLVFVRIQYSRDAVSHTSSWPNR